MRRIVIGLVGVIGVVGLAAQQSDPQPTCKMCPGTYIAKSEVDAYVNKAVAEKLIDQQMRDIDIGKAHIGIGAVYRGKLDAPAPDSVAEHDLVSEVYHIIDGSATLVTSPDIVGAKRRPATLETVRLFNGPGNNGSSVRERRGARAEGRRRHRDSRGHRPLVHQDSRSHQLSDGADRSGQGDAAQG